MPKEPEKLAELRSQLSGLQSLLGEKKGENKVATADEPKGKKSPLEKLLGGDVVEAGGDYVAGVIEGCAKGIGKLLDTIFNGKAYATIKEANADKTIGEIESLIADLEAQIKEEEEKGGEEKEGEGEKEKGNNPSKQENNSNMDNAKNETVVVIEGLQGETSTDPESEGKLPDSTNKDTQAQH